ncbi:MAG TPA: nickel ABC transporter permease [Thermomicrobiales bacterium]|nr:nickel ABC transporter permease [Thermomicrobiales bacterium]
MLRFIYMRLLLMIPVIMIVSVLVFLMVHLIPGDPVQSLLGDSGASKERIEEVREQLGLNDPLPVQYVNFVKDVATGDLKSIRTRRPVFETFREMFPKTLQLAGAALALAIVIGVPLGILAASRQHSALDYISMATSFVGVSIPNFWLAMLLVYVFAIQLNWLPATGGEGFKRLILPAIVLAVQQAALIARMVRANMIEVLQDDYIKTARAKGLSERTVVMGHGLRNALIPTITILGINFGYLLSGAVIVETVFARPGIGRLLVDGILNKDFTLVQGIVLFTATAYLIVNLLTDLSYALIDPRIRY